MQHVKASTLTAMNYGAGLKQREWEVPNFRTSEKTEKRKCCCSVSLRFYLVFNLLCFGLLFFFFFWLHSITADRSVNYDRPSKNLCEWPQSVTSKGRRREPEKLIVIADTACDTFKPLIDTVSAKMVRMMDTITQPRCSKAKASCSLLRSLHTNNDNNNVPSRAFLTTAAVGPLWLCLRHDTIPGVPKYGSSMDTCRPSAHVCHTLPDLWQPLPASYCQHHCLAIQSVFIIKQFSDFVWDPVLTGLLATSTPLQTPFITSTSLYFCIWSTQITSEDGEMHNSQSSAC